LLHLTLALRQYKKWTEPSHWNSNIEPYISLIFAQGLVIHVSHWGFTVKDQEPDMMNEDLETEL